MTVYRKDDLYPVAIKLTNVQGNPTPTLLSALFHKRYFVLYIL